jgi:Choline/Carnitine o-acyltransferase
MCLWCARVWSGLRKVLKEGESVPEIFDDPVVKRASHWVLSTSALYSKHLREYGWGEVCSFSFLTHFISVDELHRLCLTALVSLTSLVLTVRMWMTGRSEQC